MENGCWKILTYHNFYPQTVENTLLTFKLYLFSIEDY